MRQQVAAAHKETAPVLEEASILMCQREQVESKQQILAAFNKHFVITDGEQNSLLSSGEPVDDVFFSSLSRVKSIHQDCQILLGNEDQTLGLEIMEKSSKLLNGAFQKLYRWIQNEFKSLNLENPQINASIRRALRILAERPTLFQSCMDSFAEAREHVLSDSFHAALTGSSTEPDIQATAKPIELFAHDPLRYVGDMLAWTHSTSVSEREALEALFISEGDEMSKGIQAGLESEPWSRDEGEEVEPFDGRKALNGLVNRDLAGVARVLRQRVDQVVQGHEDSVLAYRIANLVNFYRVTFNKLLGDDSLILKTLEALEESGMRQFRAITRDRIALVQSELPQAPADQAVPDFLAEALDQMNAVMKSFDTSLTPPETREEDFRPILAEALDPYLQGCDALSKSLEEPANSIFSLNCLIATKKTLASYSFVLEKISEIDDTIEEQADKLTEYQHAWFLHTSGLHPLIAALASLSEDEEDLRSVPNLLPFKPATLSQTSQTLDEFLPSAQMDAMENLKALQSQRVAQEITEEAASRFCLDFEFVESRITAADNLTVANNVESDDEEPHGLRALFPRTGGEIRVLLS